MQCLVGPHSVALPKVLVSWHLSEASNLVVRNKGFAVHPPYLYVVMDAHPMGSLFEAPQGLGLGLGLGCLFEAPMTIT